MRDKFQDWLCPDCCLKLDSTEERNLRGNFKQQCYHCENVYGFNGLNIYKCLKLNLDKTDFYL